MSSYVDIKNKSEPDLQVAVATIGPISAGIDASHISLKVENWQESSSYAVVLNLPIIFAPMCNDKTVSPFALQLYQMGVYHDYFCSQTKLDHGVLVAGYGNQYGKEYWFVKNR